MSTQKGPDFRKIIFPNQNGRAETFRKKGFDLFRRCDGFRAGELLPNYREDVVAVDFYVFFCRGSIVGSKGEDVGTLLGPEYPGPAVVS